MSMTTTTRYHELVGEARERFIGDTAEHEMTVLHDDGLYRHLRFKRPDESFYWFDLITWPGVLVISGDVGAYTFSRLEDMFEFFAGSRAHGFGDAQWGINPGYWAEKLRGPANMPTDVLARTYSEDKFKALVRGWAEEVSGQIPADDGETLLGAMQDALADPDGYLAHESEARRLLHEFNHKGYVIADSWEWDLREFDWSYLWCCWAIVWGIEQYRAVKAAKGEAS
jgi:hypothetical protein